MNLIELIRLAFNRLRTSRLRSALTMLGVIIGVASVVALVSVGQGATSGITSQIEALGTNLLTVNPGSSTTGLTNNGFGTAETLTLDDSNALASLPGIAAVAPEITTSELVLNGTKNTTTSIIGTTTDYAAVRNETIYQGSFLNDASQENSLRIAVIGATTADNLGLTAADVGSEITIRGIPFEIVGLLQPKGGIGNQDDAIYVPLSVVQRELVGTSDSVRAIFVSASDTVSVDQAKAEITALLEQRHGTNGTNDDFSIADQSQLLSTFASISGVLSLLLAGIASISLVVGGIGIMNIMLVSVRERTREIGIRKAIGARGRDILAQFLIEALTLSVLGGVFGIVLGILVSALIGAIAGWGLQISPLTLVAAVGFSLLVGIVFGVWPARQAARLDPIAALRYE
ncbi:MAG TPA: ABC transporter permease [Candidatus Limnocylindrales bacterium]|jgi:putative ABC transport system permease protein